MEQEHPIPQQISSYQFRLVGDMTLKQFFQVAGGALLSLIIYSSSFAPYIKWPLILLSFLTGIAFAFFPLEDRPLSKWVFLFLKSIYSPTLYAWRKVDKRPQYFQPEPTTLPTQAPTMSAMGTPIAPSISPSTSEPAPKEIQKFEEKEKEFISKVSANFQSSTQIAANQFPAATSTKQIPVPKKVIPRVEISEKEKLPVQTRTVQPTSDSGGMIIPSVGQKPTNTRIAEFSLQASPPIPPSKANVIVGQVVDGEGKIIENAILEIRDEEGRPVRALKSNKLGHFMIVTPLANGKYEITTEKDGFDFQSITFEARGEIIPSVVVRARQETASDQTGPITNNS